MSKYFCPECAFFGKSTDLDVVDGIYVCQQCQTTYTNEELCNAIVLHVQGLESDAEWIRQFLLQPLQKKRRSES